MDIDTHISTVIDRGHAGGLPALQNNERFIFLISEAEVLCDMEGIETFLDQYSTEQVVETANAFAGVGAVRIAAILHQLAQRLPERPEEFLHVADELIKKRDGYSYDSMCDAVRRQWKERS